MIDSMDDELNALWLEVETLTGIKYLRRTTLPNVSDQFCDNMIEQFESSPEQYEKHNQGEMSFTQIHLVSNELWRTKVFYLIDVFKLSIKKYREDCNIKYDTNIWPQKYGFEGMRL